MCPEQPDIISRPVWRCSVGYLSDATRPPHGKLPATQIYNTNITDMENIIHIQTYFMQ